MNKKVALITNIISPYRIPCFNKIAEANEFSFDVFFYAEKEKNRNWKVYKEKIDFNYTVLSGLHIRFKNQREFHLNLGMSYHLFKNKYDLLAIGGYDQIASWEALLFSKLFKTKVLLFGESTLKDKRSKNPIYEKLKRFFIRNCHAFLASGKASSEYFKYLGAQPDKISIAPFSADHNYFKNEYLRLKPFKEEIKKKKGYPAIPILFSGRFVASKGIFFLIEAFEKLQKEIKDIGLILLGSGPEKKNYEKYCKLNKISNVYFEGFIQQEQLSEYYMAAEIFVLPSLSDTWGIVINEAMEFELPIISTDIAGAAKDLVYEGRNGYIVKAGDTNSLYIALKKLCTNSKLRRRMGMESLKIIEDYTPEKWAEAFIKVAKMLLKI